MAELKSKFFTKRGTDTRIVLSQNYWDAWYGVAERSRGENPSVWGKATPAMVEHITRTVGPLSGKRILDLAGGDGRYAVHLALMGAKVFAVDYSKTAILLLRAAALRYCHNVTTSNGDPTHVFQGGGSLTAVETDVLDFFSNQRSQFSNGMDVVLSSGLAEYLSPEELRMVVMSVQQVTRVGGINLWVYLLDEPGVSRLPGENPHAPRTIEALYPAPDWDIVYTNSTDPLEKRMRPDTHVVITPDDPVCESVLETKSPELHIHSIGRMVTQKH